MLDDKKKMAIDSLFQETMLRLKEFNKEKLELIKKFREQNNIAELNKIRQSLKN